MQSIKKVFVRKRRRTMWRLNQIVVALGVVFIACIATMGQEIRSNYLPRTNFAKYHTYKWVAIEGGSHPNQIVDAQIKQSVDVQLTLKGLTKTDSDTADLYVSYQTALNREKQWDAFGTGGIRLNGGIASATSST